MAYGDWSEGLQDLWDNTPGTAPGEMDAYERAIAEFEFERGFGYTGEEYETMGLAPDQVYAARKNFFDFMGILEKNFDWAAWRDEMGYQEA